LKALGALQLTAGGVSAMRAVSMARRFQQRAPVAISWRERSALTRASVVVHA
jgi:hypothetical protein